MYSKGFQRLNELVNCHEQFCTHTHTHTHTHTYTNTASVLDVRLVNGSNSSEGRVEVNYNQEGWGTICDDLWDINDADVVCKMLGFKSASRAPKRAFFGAGSGYVWMDDLLCYGNESTLLDCSHSGLKVHNCRHSEDAGVTCTSK